MAALTRTKPGDSPNEKFMKYKTNLAIQDELGHQNSPLRYSKPDKIHPRKVDESMEIMRLKEMNEED